MDVAFELNRICFLFMYPHDDDHRDMPQFEFDRSSDSNTAAQCNPTTLHTLAVCVRQTEIALVVGNVQTDAL